MRVRWFTLFALVLSLAMGMNIDAQRPKGPKHVDDDGMSPMGRRALKRAKARAAAFLVEKGLIDVPDDSSSDDPPADPIECDDNGCDPGSGDEEDGPNAAQSELAIAIDASGSHIVIGFNDFRGFSLSPLSVSGYAYSDDGGATFVDGGQLPVVANGQMGTTKLPQVVGDPDVKYIGNCTFIYSSIFVKGYSGVAPNFTGTAQTMSIHRSTDCGHSWSGPFEVTAATNPHGALVSNVNLNARDAADKEFLDVDPDTGRVLLSWSNFSSVALTGILGGVEIRTTYSDNITAATPTWSAGVVLNTGSTTFDTGSIPRFAGNGSNNVHVAWATQSSTGLSNTRVATSTNNGASWAPSVRLNASDFFPIDYILGNDRVHSFPGLAVGPEGNVYVAYANNANRDGSDIAFHRSTDGGVTFSAATFLNSRPGNDRPQWFPYVAADGNGRVYVTYYDQGVAASGDLTQVRFNYSNDGGATWSIASSLMSDGCLGIATDPRDCRPFHAGYGNDTGQPNLGDYIGATTFNGTLYAVWAASPRVVSFTDGQPTGNFNAPDFYVNKATTARAALVFGGITFTDSGGNGFVDPGDQLSFTLPLTNSVTNPVNGAQTYSGISGALSTSTPGVSIVSGTSTYPNIAPGATASNATPYVVQVDQSFTPGTPIEFSLAVSTAQAPTTLPFTRSTGTPIATTIFSENFNGVPAGSLPAGWGTIHAGGANTVPWTTNNSFCGATSNGLFHQNANDGPTGGSPARFERVASPNIVVPAGAEYVTLDFDICYDTEDDPNFNVLAYDGALLRITDFTAGRFARANLVEAFAEQITTGNILHYPKHGPRSSNANYFQDMSMWSGDSGGFKHVTMKFPGMAGSTVQLRPDYTQDSSGTCSDVRPGHVSCGVIIDNIVMNSVVSSSVVTTSTTVASSQNPSDAGQSVTFTASVTAGSPVTTGSVAFRVDGGSPTSVAVDASGNASFTPAPLASGTHTITADYSDGTHFASSSGSVVQTVDPLPKISIDDVSVTEGNSGTVNAVFTVSLSKATNSVTAAVDFATADGTATTADNDYVAAAGTLSFAPGAATQTITVAVNGDTTFEPDEIFAVNLSNPSHATIADPQGIGTITNDDGQPKVSIDDVTVTEGNTGTTPAVFTVSLSNPSQSTTIVTFATADGTATAANNDYVPNSGTIVFAPHQTTQTISVSVNGDFVVEPDEDFFVNLSNPTNAVIGDGQGAGTIKNDDTVATTLAALVGQVQAGNNGLNGGQSQALLTRLAAAQRELGSGRVDNAIHALQQFISEVQNDSRPPQGNGNPPRLDPATAAMWIAEAQSIIGVLAN